MAYFLPRSGEDPEVFVEQAFQQNKLSKLDNRKAANVMNNWAVLLAKGSFYPQAAAALRRAVELDSDPAFYANLSTVYDKMNLLEESAAAAEQGVKLDPNDIHLRAQLCSAQLFVKKYSAAVTCFEEMEKITELDDFYATGYGLALAHAGFAAKAVTILTNIPTPDYSVRNALGMAYFKQKNYVKAAEEFKAAVEMAPDLAQARYNLAIVQLVQKNRAGALGQYKLLQEKNSAFAEKLSKILFGNKIECKGFVTRVSGGGSRD